MGRDGEQPLLANDHASEAFVPAFDDLTHSESEFERVVAVAGGVELFTVGEEFSGLGGRRSTRNRWRYRSQESWNDKDAHNEL